MSIRTRDTLAALALGVVALGLFAWGLHRPKIAWTTYDCNQLHDAAACAALGDR